MSTTTTGKIEYLPRSRRRTLVAVALAGYPVAVAALVALKHTSLNRWLILAVYLALRQQAYALSHRVLATILIAATAITEIYLTSGYTLRLDANTFWPAVMWVIVYIPALPSLMLAWIETDQPADA